MLREQINNVRVVVSPLWRSPNNIHGFILDGKSYRQIQATAQNTNYVHRFRYEDNNVDLIRVQLYYYRVRQVDPCHRFGKVARRSS